jgi:hypothetical protein
MLLQKQNCDNKQHLLLSDTKMEFVANKIGFHYKLNVFEPDFLQIRCLQLLLYRTKISIRFTMTMNTSV